MNEFEVNYNATIGQIDDYISAGLLQGTSATASLGEITLNGVEYQIQIRLEKSKKDYIDPASVVSAEVLFETKSKWKKRNPRY